MPPAALRCALLLSLLTVPCLSLADEPYWAYRFQNVDVMAAGTDGYAINLARNCIRLDAILAQILGIKTDTRIPTHIYSLSRSTMRRITGEDYDSYYNVSRNGTIVVTDSGESLSGRVYRGGYYGYVGGLLAAGKLLKGPHWYMVGLPSVFSETVFEGNKVKLGIISAGHAYTLTHAALIPMRTFLSMTQQDAQAHGQHDFEMYSAEAWYLARLIFVEGKHRAEFGKYLDLMRAGQPEAEAFASSFKISYEELDHEIALAMREAGHVYIMDAPQDPGAATAVALRLSPAEADASLAFLAMDFKHGADPVQLARQALQSDPKNETALRALALALYEKESYTESLDAVNRLAALQRSRANYADSAEILAGLALSASHARLPVDSPTLMQRAKDDYTHALALDADDYRSRQGLAQLEQQLH
jgi:hypothetical protein